MYQKHWKCYNLLFLRKACDFYYYIFSQNLFFCYINIFTNIFIHINNYLSYIDLFIVIKSFIISNYFLKFLFVLSPAEN